MSYLVLFCSCVLITFSIAISSLGEERANVNAIRTFVRFVLLFCRFPLPLCVLEGLRFVVAALPGLFPYLFLKYELKRFQMKQLIKSNETTSFQVIKWSATKKF